MVGVKEEEASGNYVDEDDVANGRKRRAAEVARLKLVPRSPRFSR